MLALLCRVLSRYLAGSSVNQQTLAKEKVTDTQRHTDTAQHIPAQPGAYWHGTTAAYGVRGCLQGLGQALLPALGAHCRDATVVPPLLELVALLSRTSRGAQTLAGEQMVTAAKELLVNFMVRVITIPRVTLNALSCYC